MIYDLNHGFARINTDLAKNEQKDTRLRFSGYAKSYAVTRRTSPRQAKRATRLRFTTPPRQGELSGKLLKMRNFDAD